MINQYILSRNNYRIMSQIKVSPRPAHIIITLEDYPTSCLSSDCRVQMCEVLSLLVHPLRRLELHSLDWWTDRVILIYTKTYTSFAGV